MLSPEAQADEWITSRKRRPSTKAAVRRGRLSSNCGGTRWVCSTGDAGHGSRGLEMLGYQVEVFASAEVFLASPSTGHVDCLVLDIGMPGMTGPELHSKLRGEGNMTPVTLSRLMMTTVPAQHPWSKVLSTAC
ncbi:response regulator [Rhizobium ruizarguesonis]|nr:response regulator [Rhizobium ruizarguesonis]TBD15588.1 response regulator [Rhizobium ruizarguesonis]TBE96644.1 response regulator [Rhizobium ruizarguesonis]